MFFIEILKNNSQSQIATNIGISKSFLNHQINKSGFSAKTIKKLLAFYPDLDANDLIKNYPKP